MSRRRVGGNYQSSYTKALASERAELLRKLEHAVITPGVEWLVEGFTVLGPGASAQRYRGTWGVFNGEAALSSDRLFDAPNFTTALRWIAEEVNGDHAPIV